MSIVYNGIRDDRSYKEVLGEILAELLEQDPCVVYLDADLMNCIGTGNLPSVTDRAIECGISEANMVGVACGLSASGFIPYIHTFGAFASRRVYDQIFLSGGYAGNPITVIGTDPGITAALNGGTHMPFEDMALYRALPGATVVDVTDISMLQFFLRAAKKLPGVKYIRVGRKQSYPVYSGDHPFAVGRGCVLREGEDAVIIACGILVHEALQAAQQLDRQGIHVTVIDPFTVKPLDRDLIRNYAKNIGCVITAENHSCIGGLTSAVQDAICGLPCRFGSVAIEDEFGEVGPQDYLRERFGLTAERIMKTVVSLC